MAVELCRDRKIAAGEAKHRIGVGVHFRLGTEEHLEAGIDQEGAEEIEDPMKLGDERGAAQDHAATHGDRPHDAPEEDAMLEAEGNTEVREDQRYHEHVVHRQREFDQIAGEELEAVLVGTPAVDPEPEAQRQEDPESGPTQGLAKPHDTGPTMEHAEVEGQKAHHRHQEHDPVPDGDHPVHRRKVRSDATGLGL